MANPQDNELLDTMIFGDIPIARIMERADKLRDGVGKAPDEAGEVEDPAIDQNDIRTYIGYIHYAELLNFFAAIVLDEIERAPGALVPWSEGPVPVQLWAVGEYNEEGVRGRNNQTRYDLERWTMWGWYGAKRTSLLDGLNPNTGNPLTISRLIQEGVLYKDRWAIFELAGIRLLAAFSHMHMMYHWSDPETQSPMEALRGGKDVIADLPVLNPTDPARMLRTPVDPRWSWKAGTDPFNVANWSRPDYQYIHKAVIAREAAFKPYMDQARAQALTDHQTQIVYFANKLQQLYASGAAAQTMVGGGAVSAYAQQQQKTAIQKMAESGQLTLTAEAAAEKAAYAQMTPEQQAAFYQQTLAKQKAQQAGAGGVAAVAGLGLLALLLMRR